MTPLRSLSKTLNGFVRDVLDRKVYGHRFRACSDSDPR
jgi:hypothetical protein